MTFGARWGQRAIAAGLLAFAALGSCTRQPIVPRSQPIGANNVASLVVAWTYHTGDLARPNGAKRASSLEVRPLYADGRLLVCTPLGATVALDPGTGRELWRFAPSPGKASDGVCRGVGYWHAMRGAAAGACGARTFRAVGSDGGPRLYALDAATGKPCGDFGAEAGHPGYVAFSDLDWRGKRPAMAMFAAPVVLRDRVIVGTAVIDNQSAAPVDGFVRAFEVRSGRELWAFSAIPASASARTGGSNVWAPIAVDTAADRIFLPTTSPAPDHYGGARTMPLPLSNAVVALDGATGTVLWSFQTIHHDLFDFDLPAEPLLAELPWRGQIRKVVVQTTKTGFTFVLDRETGKSLFPIPERAVPRSDVPGEQASPTQPWPDLPQPYAAQQLTRATLFGLTPWERGYCRRHFDAARYDGMFTPPTLQGSIMFPSILGGGNWGGAAYDAARHLLIVKSSNLATYMKMVPKRPGEAEPPRSPGGFHIEKRFVPGSPYRMDGDDFMSPLGIPCTPPPWGTLTALDLTTGRIAWQVPLGQVRRFGIDLPEWLGWGSPSVGGPLVLPTGVTFIASTLDGKLRAFDTSTGKTLWRKRLPAPGMAQPVSYVQNGKQYIVIAAGGNAFAKTKLGDAIVAFTLKDR